MEGTELSDAYNMNVYLETSRPQEKPRPQVQMQAQTQAQTQQRIPEQIQVQEQEQVQMRARAPTVVPSKPPIIYSTPVQRIPTQEHFQPSHIDNMIQKRRDLLKMISIAVIILLAISLHTVVDCGLKELIISHDFSFKQELGIKILYPVIVVFILWNLKAITHRSIIS